MPKTKKDSINEADISRKTSLRQTINVFLSRYFRYLSIIIALLVMAGAYFYLLKPKYNKILLEIDNTKNTQEAEREDLDQYYNKLLDYIAEYKKIKKADIEKISKLRTCWIEFVIKYSKIMICFKP